MAGAVAAGSPRWLRLVRSGARLTAYDSADGKSWDRVGVTSLAALQSTIQIGLFATSPASYEGLPTLVTANFDQVTLQAANSSGAWQGRSIGSGAGYPTLAQGSYSRSGGSFVVSGSGDVAPLVPFEGLAADSVSDTLPFGLIVGLIAAIVVATMFVTSEYRRGLIRTTFAAVPAA